MPLLHWLNDEEARKTSSQIPYRLLEADPKLSYHSRAERSDSEVEAGVRSENMLIQGDNLEALKALLPYYAGQVKCIYIDPPYNTQSAFEHYDDNVEHSIWLSTMYPRLEMLRQLLSEDGSIWVSIDDNEGHYLKVLMDEIFGRGNFVANAVWQKVYSERMDAKEFSASHDHILVFKKSENFKINKLQIEQDDKQFNFFDESTGKFYRRRSLRKEGSSSRREDRPNLWYSIEAPDGSLVYPIRPSTNTEGNWRWSKETFRKNSELGIVEWVKTSKGWEIYVKQYKEESATRPPNTWWTHEETGHNHEAKEEARQFSSSEVFSTPKPERLLKRILAIATNPNDLVLDSFLGSGTTAAVAHKMGRRYIGIEMGDHAVTHCAPRLQKVIEGEQGGISKEVNWQGGGGFNFYRLGETIFDEQGHINPKVKFKPLAAHVWFSETHTPYLTPSPSPKRRGELSPLLGVHNETAYYLLYNGILGDKTPTGGNVLTSRVLRELPKHKGKKVIYGEMSMLEEAVLQKQEITFKHIPYDIKAR